MAATTTKTTKTEQLERQEQPASGEQPLLDQVLERTLENTDREASRYKAALDEPGLLPLKRAMLTAAAIERLEQMLDGRMMARIMRLMNTRLGFKTDRGPGSRNSTPYAEADVK